jgi:hypothetical protein
MRTPTLHVLVQQAELFEGLAKSAHERGDSLTTFGYVESGRVLHNRGYSYNERASRIRSRIAEAWADDRLFWDRPA